MQQRNGAVADSGNVSERRFCRTGEITTAHKLMGMTSREGTLTV